MVRQVGRILVVDAESGRGVREASGNLNVRLPDPPPTLLTFQIAGRVPRILSSSSVELSVSTSQTETWNVEHETWNALRGGQRFVEEGQGGVQPVVNS